jgi:hypothetical protein
MGVVEVKSFLPEARTDKFGDGFDQGRDDFVRLHYGGLP